mgnify:CR=1 FL=1
MPPRRKHFKIDQLPPELVEAINRRLVDGWTYRDLAEWLDKQGAPVSKSAVGRYGKDFLIRLEALKATREKAKAIVESAPDSPAMELNEAANQLAVTLITETLMSVESLDGEKISDLLKALAQLERSGVAREKLKMEFNRGVNTAFAKIRAELPKAIQADPDLAARIDTLIQSIAKELQ